MKIVDHLLKTLVSAFAVLITAYLLPGVEIDSFLTAIITAAVLSILNIFVKPVLVLLTIPVTIFTFGLFLIAINTFIILISSNLVEGFEVYSWGWALLFSVILSIVTSILETFNRVINKENY